MNIYNNANSLNLDNYFFNTKPEFNNSNLVDFNSIKQNNSFLNNNLNFKISDNSIYSNYFSTFNYSKHLSFNKLYIPKPFNASHSNIYNGLPWFLDYVHLSFWFFFISTVISILFIIYFFNFIWNNQENKYPIRETRGFSRAQTGDTMTAIIPMTWSITMLLHASTHSNNFDENVTGTQFCLTVIAYQWGWNYYYPKDIIDIFNKMPIKVGHGGIDYYSTFDDYYKRLLDVSRNQLLNKNFLLGIGSSKIGKNNIQTFQSLFFKPYGSKGNLEIPSVLFFNINNKKNNYKIDLLDLEIKKYIQKIEESSVNYMYNDNDSLYTNYININNLNNLNQNFYFYLLNSSFNVLNFYKNLKYYFFFKNFESNYFFYNIINFSEILNKSSLNNILCKKFFNSNNISKYKSIDSHRNKNTFFSNSNKLYLTYRAILNEYKKPLDKNFINLMNEIVDRQNILNYVRKKFNDSVNIQRYMLNQINSFDDFDFYILRHVYSFNIAINQWIIDNDYIFNFSNKYNINSNNVDQFLWVNSLKFNKINFDFKSLIHYNKNKNLNFNDFFQNTYFLFNNNLNVFNFKKIFQSFLYLSEDNSYNFYNNSILTFEDFGFINTSTLKELLYKNTIYSDFYIFNVLKFFKVYNDFFFFNKKFLFNINNYSINYKFWELDSNLFLIQNNIFNNNVFNINNVFSLDNNFIYFWPSFTLNLLKNWKYFSIHNNSLPNLLKYKHYSIKNNFFMPNLLFYRKCWRSFFFKLFNRNKYQDVYFCDFENNIFNFKKVYFISNELKLSNKITTLRFNIFKFTMLNYIIFNKIYLYNINNSLFNKNSKLLLNKSILNDLLMFNNNLNFLFLYLLNYNIKSRLFEIKFIANNLILDFNEKNVLKKVNNMFLNFDTILLNNLNISFWDIFFNKNFNNSILYFDKPIRIGLKFNDPYDFNFKLNNDISNIYYVNKYLVTWQLSWSNYVKNFSLPSYKFFKGSVDKKNFSSFSNTKNLNNSFDDDLKFQNYKLPILKNYKNIKRKDFSYWKNSDIYKKYDNSVSSYQNIIDFEKFNFFKNYISYLPNVNDDIDVNFLLKYLTFDINTSRRNDHNTKFRVFWGPLFTKYIKKLYYTNRIDNNLLTSLNIKNINFFKSFNLNLLKFDSFYLQNYSFQKNYFLINLKVINKNASLKINFLKNNFFWNFNYLRINSILEIKNLKILLNNTYPNDTLYSFDYFFYENNYFNYFLFNNNFLNYWSFFWFFKDNLHNFSNKIFFNKNFKDNLSIINKAYLILSFKDKEFKNLYLKNNNYFNINNNLFIDDFSSIFNLYQNFFDIKKNTILNNDNLKLHLFSDLNMFKYLNNYSVFDNKLLNNIKSLYYDYYLLQLQKSDKYRFNFKEINNNISNIKRLRVSKGICLPSDFNIHIICASKDVIHSWAIPGLGIKIDCIPGFNSHRKVLFRWRGLYWGQCMEVCGRYHHWMPILVRIVHKDLFLSWCLSFLRALHNKNYKYEKYYFDEILLLNFLADSSNSDILDNFFNTIQSKNNKELLLYFIESSIIN